MIKIYISPSCSSCRKVRKWFDEQGIPYEAKNIFSPSLSKKDVMEMISKSENGTDDIISTRSKIVQEENIDFDSMTISELVDFILKNPSILKRPIIIDDRRVQVGYNEEEIRTFLPRARRLVSDTCNPEGCEQWGCCDFSKDIIAAQNSFKQAK